jgi:hypothetical protein
MLSRGALSPSGAHAADSVGASISSTKKVRPAASSSGARPKRHTLGTSGQKPLRDLSTPPRSSRNDGSVASWRTG